jgi:hypothetical protein
MSVISPTISAIKAYEENTNIVEWTPVTEADTCAPVEMPGFTVRSIQIDGTFGGATVTFQGSNNGTTYATLSDPQGNAISKTSAAIEQVEEVTRYVKPVLAGGSSTSLKMTLLLVRRGR